MKILFLSHKFYPDIGGIEVNSEILASQFQAAGFEVRLLTWTTGTGPTTFSFEIIRNPSFLQLLLSHQWADVVYENNPCLRMSWPNLFIKKPLVVALRTWIARTNGSINWQDSIKIYWLRRAAAVIAVSETLRARIWPKAKVIGNPYRRNIFKIIPDVARDLEFVFIGRLVSDKGCSLAIKALHLLKGNSDNSNLHLTVIGDGPEKLMLEALADELGIGTDVTFTGNLIGRELVNCLNRHRILLVPSIWEEPFGNVALEGMACGCIPVVSDRGGLPDAVGKAGLTFKSGDLDAFVDTIEKILKNPTLNEELRNNAPAHLKAHHPDIVATKYLDVINNVLN